MSVLLCLLLALILPGAADASKSLPVTEPRFSIWISPQHFVDQSGLWAPGIWVMAHPSRRGTLRLEPGEGLELVEGSHVVGVAPGTRPRWGLKLKRTKRGPVTIRFSLQIEGKDSRSYDLYERLLEVDFRPWHDGIDTVLVRENRVLSVIAVRDGKRYRYGDLRFVAIEGDEKESPRDFQQRAALLSSEDIRCKDCGLREAAVIPVVVTVGSKGRVTWVRPNLGRERDPADVADASIAPTVWGAIERGVRQFKYQTARADGRAVADYTTFDVRVVP